MGNDRFWFVWNPSGRSPSYKHPSLSSAKKEAIRLAGMNPGQEFIVLESAGRAELPIKWTDNHQAMVDCQESCPV
jgi:hypothetical protein